MFVRVLGSPRTLFVCGRNTVSCKLLRSVGDGTAAKIRGLDHSWGGLREGRGEVEEELREYENCNN